MEYTTLFSLFWDQGRSSLHYALEIISFCESSNKDLFMKLYTHLPAADCMGCMAECMVKSRSILRILYISIEQNTDGFSVCFIIVQHR